MNEQEAREYSESLGQIFDGGYRQAAWADKQKIPQALGITMREWVYEYLGGYVRMSVEQRNAAVLELAEEGTSKEAISRVLGIDKTTVRAALGEDVPSKPSGWAKDDDAHRLASQDNDDAHRPEGSSSSAWGQILKDASKAAREDPLANVYGLLKSAALIKGHLDPDMFADADEDERLRVFNDLEEALATMRRVQDYAVGNATVRVSA